MNQRGVDALLAAEAAGVRQVFRMNTDGKNGRCAMGVLIDSWAAERGVQLVVASNGCYDYSSDDADAIIHLFGLQSHKNALRIVDDNNDGMTFRQIAEKYGPQENPRARGRHHKANRSSGRGPIPRLASDRTPRWQRQRGMLHW